MRIATIMLTEEASTLGLRPGFWPETLQVKGQSFIKSHQHFTETDRELVSVIYRAKGVVLEVLND